MKNQKYIKIVFFIIISTMIHNNIEAQNVDFIFNSDSAIVGRTITFTNTSDSAISNAIFVWKFENNIIIYTHPMTFLDEFDTTRSVNEDVVNSFLFPKDYNITLYCIDSATDSIIGIKAKTITVKTKYCESTWLTACDLLLNKNFDLINFNAINAPLYWDLGRLGVASCYWTFATNCFSHGCPDLFYDNSSNPNVDIPSNLFGIQDPISNNGHAYVGFLAYRDVDGYREYIQQNLTPYSLVTGQKYIIGMYVSLSDNSRYAIKDIGIALTNTCYQCCALGNLFRYSLTETGNNCITIQPQVKAKNIISNKNDWVLIIDTIIGNNENTLTIGNFSDNNTTALNMFDLGSNYVIHYPGHDENDAYYYVDSVFLVPYHEGENSEFPICHGSSIELNSSMVFDENYNYFDYLWQPGNYVTNSITVSPTLNTTYTCTAYDLITQCAIIDTFNVVVMDPPDTPIIQGNNNTCDTNAVYSISNAQVGNTYSWSIGDANYSDSFPQTGSSISVVWHPLWTTSSVHTWLKVVATDTNGCSATDSIKIWKCCKKNDSNIVYNDETITDASVFIGNPVPPYFNGTITVNADINASNISNIFVGPEAKFIVNPPYTFTITTSNILAGCLYMWDGIYVTDSNAKVVIEQQSSLTDALNAIYSENGGKFELKNSNFYNNYTAVLVKNNFYGAGGPWYSHKGLIYGCTFSKSGNGMIAPYLYGKPMHGVFSDNVYNLTIGDSTQGTTGRNTFSNIFCGIASFYSSINVYNNHFYFINTHSCTPTPGDYYNLQCETAIHCAAVYQDVYHNSSQLICGAGNNSLNTFDTCRYAIYTYNTLTKVDRAKITRTGVGVYCREAKTYSFVKNSSVMNKISAGIEFVNTLALTRGYTIYNDTVLDPLMGIYLLNVTSNPNFSTLQTTVSNNYISNVRNVPMYGMDFEVCDYIDAYCNKVRRDNLPPSNYRLLIRGTQINHSVSTQLHDNTYDTLGVSVKGRGSLLGTQFKCNTTDGSYNGFYFDATNGSVATALSSQYNIQGTDTVPNDNKWYNIPATYYGIDAVSGFSLNPNIKWYYRDNAGAQYIPTEPYWLVPFIFPVIKNSNQFSYTNCGGLMMAGMNTSSENTINYFNESEINNIVNETNYYGVLDGAFKYFEKQYFYKKFNVHPQMFIPSTSSYFFNLKNGNIGKFEQIYREIENGSIENALTLNDQINPINTIEKNRKWINSIYFDYIVPQKSIPQNIIDELETLASSSPFVNGDAVFSARAIVGYPEDESAVINNKNFDVTPGTNTTNVDNVEIRVYPNPAKEYITVEIIGNDYKSVDFTITNMLGILVLEKIIKVSNTAINIDVHRLKQGIYIYEATLKSNGESIKKGRIVIGG